MMSPEQRKRYTRICEHFTRMHDALPRSFFDGNPPSKLASSYAQTAVAELGQICSILFHDFISENIATRFPVISHHARVTPIQSDTLVSISDTPPFMEAIKIAMGDDGLAWPCFEIALNAAVAHHKIAEYFEVFGRRTDSLPYIRLRNAANSTDSIRIQLEECLRETSADHSTRICLKCRAVGATGGSGVSRDRPDTSQIDRS